MSLSRNNRPETSGVDCFEAKQNSGKDAAQSFQQATGQISALQHAGHQYHPSRADLF